MRHGHKSSTPFQKRSTNNTRADMLERRHTAALCAIMTTNGKGGFHDRRLPKMHNTSPATRRGRKRFWRRGDGKAQQRSHRLGKRAHTCKGSAEDSVSKTAIDTVKRAPEETTDTRTWTRSDLQKCLSILSQRVWMRRSRQLCLSL